MTERVQRLTMSVVRDVGRAGHQQQDRVRSDPHTGFPAIRIGHRVRVSREGLAEWVKANEGNKLEVAL